MVSCLSVRYFLENSRTLESWTLSSRANIEFKLRACDTQAGSFVNAASGELEDSGNPDRNRAASSIVTVSMLCAGAALSASINVIKIATFNPGIDRHTFRILCPLLPTPFEIIDGRFMATLRHRRTCATARPLQSRDFASDQVYPLPSAMPAKK